jgi:5-deoxy-glucuronate isomerase
MTSHTWFHPRGTLQRDVWDCVVDDSIPGWGHTGLRVVTVSDGDRVTLIERGIERVFVPLEGSFQIAHRRIADETETNLRGRASVFSGPTDVLYLGCDTFKVTIRGAGRIAIAEAPADIVKRWRHLRPEQYPTELRGAGTSSRQVHNFGTPEALDAARLIVCEVITPAGNWSSYPPHKHDEHLPGHESRLEEIYYFESAPVKGSPAPSHAKPFGMFSTYSSPAGEIDINARVRTGDVALVPFGYHGPAVAAPGYDLYYLNVMAGPDSERDWMISDDPAHAWIRQVWDEQTTDSRLPFGTATRGAR